MTIYYTSVFFILVVEMVAFGILVVPLPSRWRRAMHKFVSTSPLVTKGISTLKIIFGFIFLLFIDAVNRLQRIEEVSEEQRGNHDFGYEAAQKATKFYAQRNLYLTGFTLFLSLILERTSTLVVSMLQHEEQLEDARKEHVSSSQDKGRLVAMEQDYKNKIDALNKELDELKQRERDSKTLKKRMADQAEEYHQLATKKKELESKMT